MMSPPDSATTTLPLLFPDHDSIELRRHRALTAIASDWTWQADAQMRINWLSRSALSRGGILSHDVLGKAFWDNDKIIPAFHESWDTLKHVVDQRMFFRDIVICYINAHQQLICNSISGAPQFSAEGEFLGYVGLATNLTESSQKEQGLLRLLERDPLTGFANLKTMQDTLERSLINARRHVKVIGFLFLRFPELPALLNDRPLLNTYRILRNICQHISKFVRHGDLIGRLATHEFAIILLEISQQEDLDRILKKVETAFNAPITYDESTITLNAKALCLSAPQHGEILDDLIRKSRLLLDQQSQERHA